MKEYTAEGTVIGGKRLGRTLGFPTANIVPQGEARHIPHGVYAATATVEGTLLRGVANVGTKPTVDDGRTLLLEIHLFDFSGDLYGQRLTVRLHRRLRDEVRFASVEELQRQIGKDIEETKRYFANDKEGDHETL